jgi:hypothetical protein
MCHAGRRLRTLGNTSASTSIPPVNSAAHFRNPKALGSLKLTQKTQKRGPRSVSHMPTLPPCRHPPINLPPDPPNRREPHQCRHPPHPRQPAQRCHNPVIPPSDTPSAATPDPYPSGSGACDITRSATATATETTPATAATYRYTRRPFRLCANVPQCYFRHPPALRYEPVTGATQQKGWGAEEGRPSQSRPRPLSPSSAGLGAVDIPIGGVVRLAAPGNRA